jgi:hypothetical protein
MQKGKRGLSQSQGHEDNVAKKPRLSVAGDAQQHAVPAETEASADASENGSVRADGGIVSTSNLASDLGTTPPTTTVTIATAAVEAEDCATAHNSVLNDLPSPCAPSSSGAARAQSDDVIARERDSHNGVTKPCEEQKRHAASTTAFHSSSASPSLSSPNSSSSGSSSSNSVPSSVPLASPAQALQTSQNGNGNGYYDDLENYVPASWAAVLKDEFVKPYWARLKQFLNEQYRKKLAVFPPKDKIFAAFEHCPFESVRAVIVGQVYNWR